jgi:DNA-directed RNA polymerase specialized sigma24 family protein
MAIDERTENLVRSAQRGDDRSFAVLVSEYQALAVAYAASLIGDYHLGEDAAQEAFVDMHRSLASLRDPRAFLGWFRTIVFKHADRITRRKRHPIAPADAADAVASSQPSLARTLEAQPPLARSTCLAATSPSSSLGGSSMTRSGTFSLP